AGAGGAHGAARAAAHEHRAARLPGTGSPRGGRSAAHRPRRGAQALLARARRAGTTTPGPRVSGRASSEPGTPASAGERAAQDPVRARSRPRAGDGFRARLGAEFTPGRIGAGAGVARAAPWFARPLAWVPAAAALLVVLGVASNRGPDWRLVAASGDGRVSVDGVPYALKDAALGSRLKRGGRVRVDGVTVDLV